MSGVAAAIATSATIAAATAYYVSEQEKDTAEKNRKAQTKAKDETLALQREMYETQRADIDPWKEAGQQSLERIQQGIESGEFEMQGSVPVRKSVNMANFDVRDDPGYQFRMDEGVNALDSSAAARGRLQSGAQSKGVNSFAQGLASQEFGNAYNREQNRLGVDYQNEMAQYNADANRKANMFNMLSGLANTGQVSAQTQIGSSARMAQGGGNTIQNFGNAMERANTAEGQARAGAYQNYGNIANQATENWLTYKGRK